MKHIRVFLILLITILFSLAPLACTSPGKAERLYKDGLEYMKQENLDKALESFNRSIEIDPLGNAEAYFYRAKVYESLGTYENAVFDYLKSCELGSVHCVEVMPDNLVNLEKVPKSKWEVGDFGYHDDSQGENTYGPKNVVDGLPETAWVTKDDPSSILGDMMIGFKSLADTTVSEFTIHSGYCKSMDIWEKNSRVKKVAVIINGKPVGVFELKDIINEQTFSLDKEYSLKVDDIISFLIIETYTGSKYTDVAISELRLSNDIETVMNDTHPYVPMYRGNPARTGAYDEKGVPVFHNLKWRFKTGGEIKSSPCVSEGVVYVGSRDHNFYAVEAETGKELWRFKTGYGVSSSSCVVDDVVYFGDDNLYAVDTKTGEIIWQSERVLSANPCVIYGIVYCESLNYLFVVDAITGLEKWVFRKFGVFSPPAIVDGVVYASCCDIEIEMHGSSDSDNYLFAVDAATGLEKWKFKTCTNFAPAVYDGVVYLGKRYDLYAIDIKTGQELWRFRAGIEINTSASVVNGVVYFGTSINWDYSDTPSYLFAIDAKTGQELWRFEVGDFIYSSPTIVDGVVYFGCTDKNLYAVDAKTGQELWRFETESEISYSSPCVVDGVVYIGSDDGYLYAIE